MDDADLRSRLNGITTSLVTPFQGGAVDIQAYSALIEWQIRAGVAGLVVCGTTGEVSTLAWEERIAVIRAAVRVAGGRVPVIASTGTNSTQSTIAFTSMAHSVGADGALVITPYYNRPGQEGLFRHFEAVISRAEMPVIIGNIPASTGIDMSIETLERLVDFPRLIGILDGSRDLSRPARLFARRGDRFAQWCSDDALSLGFNAAGGQGTISAAANVIPQQLVSRHEAARREDFDAVRVLDSRIQPLLDSLGPDMDPALVKAALRFWRGVSAETRLPLVPVTADARMQAAIEALSRSESSDNFIGGRADPVSIFQAMYH